MLQAPYRDRKTWMIGLHDLGGWKVKTYGITAPGASLSAVVIESALKYAADRVSEKVSESSPYGFLVLHVGTEAVWLLIDLWFDDILHHFLFRAPLEAPNQWAPGPADGTTACVWELEVIQHERNAWVRHVLSRPKDPAFDAYLAEDLEIAGARGLHQR